MRMAGVPCTSHVPGSAEEASGREVRNSKGTHRPPSTRFVTLTLGLLFQSFSMDRSPLSAASCRQATSSQLAAGATAVLETLEIEIPLSLTHHCRPQEGARPRPGSRPPAQWRDSLCGGNLLHKIHKPSVDIGPLTVVGRRRSPGHVQAAGRRCHGGQSSRRRRRHGRSGKHGGAAPVAGAGVRSGAHPERILRVRLQAPHLREHSASFRAISQHIAECVSWRPSAVARTRPRAPCTVCGCRPCTCARAVQIQDRNTLILCCARQQAHTRKVHTYSMPPRNRHRQMQSGNLPMYGGPE